MPIKSVIFSFLVLFSFFSPIRVFAADITYSNPTWADISSVASGNATCINSDFIGGDENDATNNAASVTAEYFCTTLGHQGLSSFLLNTASLSTSNDQISDPDVCETNSNSNPTAWRFDGSNTYKYDEILCSDPSGCTDPNSTNYDSSAIIDDGSCNTCLVNNYNGCSELGCSQYLGAQFNNGVCQPNALGCSDPYAENYNPNANTGDNSLYCEYCAPNDDAINCSTQSDCENLGGFSWNSVTNICEDPFNTGGGAVSGSGDGEVTLQIPDPNINYSVSAPISPNYYPFLNSSCTQINSSGICDKYRLDLSEDFLNFLITMLTKIGTYFFFFSITILILWFLSKGLNKLFITRVDE